LVGRAPDSLHSFALDYGQLSRNDFGAAAISSRHMAAEVKKEIELEIAHVLFIDIVAYSKLSVNEQHARIEELNEIVRSSEQFQKAEAANRILKIPTGDGMALVFYRSPEEPAQCAFEISHALKAHRRLQLRMGIHSGPVSGVVDVTARMNVAGAGINMAQRMMDCGDAGHILLSKHVAEDLEQFERWRSFLHEIGACQVKHGVSVIVTNLYSDEIGNPRLPSKLQAVRKHRAHMRWAVAAIFLLVFGVIVAGGFFFLRRSIRTAPAITDKSIAVLPFENLSSDKENAYFAEGIQDEILTRLSKIAALKVISRTSTQKYKSAPDKLREVGQQLGVAHILEGSVQKIGDAVRVNVQLIKAATDSHIWAETFDRKLTDIFAIESEVAKGIAEALQAKLTGGEENALTVKPTSNPEAYDAYLRGLALEPRVDYNTNFLNEAIAFYQQAVQLDPNFSAAWARLSRAEALVYFRAIDTSDGRRDVAKAALEKAQELAPDSPDALLALGYYQYWVLRDYGKAKDTFGLVRKILPSESEVVYALGVVARREGHWDKSLAYLGEALALDPRDADLLINTAWSYSMVRQFPAALKLYDRALEILPDDPDLIALKTIIYRAQGNLGQAGKLLSQVNTQTSLVFGTKIVQLTFERNYREALRLLRERQTQFHFASASDKGGNQLELAFIYRLAGDVTQAKSAAEEARKILEPLCRNEPENDSLAGDMALAYAILGEKDSALKEAERAIRVLPSDKDAVNGPGNEENLAAIQLLLGDDSRAISTLTRLLKTPYAGRLYNPLPVTPSLLRLDPLWDPLRNDSSFQKLCEEKQP
jgi:TolB-like protein/class 3 adenylate cyclase/Tfp pilus assembly protein PilF